MRDVEDSDKCAFCDEFRMKGTPAEYADIGMAICMKRRDGGNWGARIYVPWDGPPCVSFRLERRAMNERRGLVERMQSQSNSCCTTTDPVQ